MAKKKKPKEKQKPIIVNETIRQLKSQQKQWFQVYNFSKARIVSIDAIIKKYLKKNRNDK